MQKLAMIYMGAGIVNTMTSMVKELDKDIEVINLVNDGILPTVGRREDKEMSEVEFQQLMHLLSIAELSGADAVLVTCSSISEFVNHVKPFARIPVFKVDEPMFKEALKRGSKIGVAATVATTLKPSLRQVQALADAKGQKIELESCLVSEAYEAFLRGETDLHNQLLQSAIEKLCDANDVVCLAQASMLSVVKTMDEKYQTKILSSPALGVKNVVNYLQSIR